MKLNLQDIIERPGANKSFQFLLNVQGLSFAQVKEMPETMPVQGVVRNIAGALELSGKMQVNMTCICDRCIAPIQVAYTLPLKAYLAEMLVDEENPDIFLIKDGLVDLDEVCKTIFALSMDSKSLCRDDCAGLCSRCGANLNDGACVCEKEIDPRLEALRQLLE